MSRNCWGYFGGAVVSTVTENILKDSKESVMHKTADAQLLVRR
jgi:hypothetical protein